MYKKGKNKAESILHTFETTILAFVARIAVGYVPGVDTLGRFINYVSNSIHCGLLTTSNHNFKVCRLIRI